MARLVVDSAGKMCLPQSASAREYDATTELYYYRARYYDPALGRFISEDPVGLEGGINPYAYAGNDPVNARDPMGLCHEGVNPHPNASLYDGVIPEICNEGATKDEEGSGGPWEDPSDGSTDAGPDPGPGRRNGGVVGSGESGVLSLSCGGAVGHLVLGMIWDLGTLAAGGAGFKVLGKGLATGLPRLTGGVVSRLAGQVPAAVGPLSNAAVRRSVIKGADNLIATGVFAVQRGVAGGLKAVPETAEVVAGVAGLEKDVGFGEALWRGGANIFFGNIISGVQHVDKSCS